MARRSTARRRRAAAAGLVLVLAGLVGTACDEQTDAEPTIPTVDFEPRVVVTVDQDGIAAEAGPRDGAESGEDQVDVVTRTGSVVELRNDATGPRRVVVTRTTDDAGPDAESSVWIDTGTMEPGDRVVLGLSAAGDYSFRDATEDGPAAEPGAVVRVEVLTPA